MHRIDHATAEADKFGTGKDGFTEGTPPTIPATIVTDGIANAWQEELARAIELSGQDLVKGTYTQTANVHNRFGPADFFRVDASTGVGALLPQLPSLGTFWVTPGAGLVGQLENGAAWILIVDRAFRVALSDAEIALQNFDAYTFLNNRDSYIAISGSGLLEVNDVAPAGPEPTPTAGYDNILKVVATAGNIASCEAIAPAHPALQCNALDIGDILETARKAGIPEGFRFDYLEAANNRMRVFAFDGATDREPAWTVYDYGAAGTWQQWNGDFTWEPAQFSEARRRWRTHLGSAAEETRYIDDRSFAYEHDGGAVFETAATFTLPHDGCLLILKVNAVDEADNTRDFGFVGEYLLNKGSGGTTTIDERHNIIATVDAGIVISGGQIAVRAQGEVGPITWHFTGCIEIIPMDNTP